MPQPKTLTLLLFGSLGLNIFLGGALGSALISSKKNHAPIGAEQALSPKTLREEVHEKKAFKMQRHDGRNGQHPGARGRGHEGMPASSDSILLRQMVRVMGGSDDPRLKQLQEEQKNDLTKMRQEIHAAHERVRSALTTESANETELAEALKNLRKTTFEAQARAQEGILSLAGLMTPEERQKLREASSHRPPEHKKERRIKEKPPESTP